jgi:hypothetical protein
VITVTREEKLNWLRSLDRETISPTELALIEGNGHPYEYNCAAKQGKLTLPHVWHGRNLRIWKEPVIQLLSG